VYRARDLEKLLHEINNTGYGLTLGIHSRIEKSQHAIAKTARVENCFINRTMTVAVVGRQPFGGNPTLLELSE